MFERRCLLGQVGHLLASPNRIASRKIGYVGGKVTR